MQHFPAQSLTTSSARLKKGNQTTILKIRLGLAYVFSCTWPISHGTKIDCG